MKSEPLPRVENGVDVSYSFDRLERERETGWFGVRNYQARNFMRSMKVGDRVFFYHSSCPAPGIVGLAEVCREAYPDPSQFTAGHPFEDKASVPENPRWSQVDVRFIRRLKRFISLSELRGEAALSGMALLNRSRLSVQPVSVAEWDHILSMEERDVPEEARLGASSARSRKPGVGVKKTRPARASRKRAREEQVEVDGGGSS